MLLSLIAAQGDVVSRDELIGQGWPDVVVSDESLTQVISELRKAFVRLGCQTKPIKTISRAGYRLILDVTCEACGYVHDNRVAQASGVDLEALGLCFEAKRAVARSGEAGMKDAVLLAAEAARIAPAYAPAHAYKAVMLATLQLYRDNGAYALRDALVHAETAVRTDAHCAYAHAAFGYSLGAVGRYEQAQNAYMRAVKLDPYNTDIYHVAARTLFSARRYRLAAILAERAADLDPRCFYSMSLASRAAAAFDTVRSHIYARQALMRARETLHYDPEQPRARGILALCLAQLGHISKASSIIDNSRQSAGTAQFPDVVTRCLLGLEDAAMDALNNAMELGYRHTAWLYAEPAFAGLQKRREFRSITSRIAIG